MTHEGRTGAAQAALASLQEDAMAETSTRDFTKARQRFPLPDCAYDLLADAIGTGLSRCSGRPRVLRPDDLCSVILETSLARFGLAAPGVFGEWGLVEWREVGDAIDALLYADPKSVPAWDGDSILNFSRSDRARLRPGLLAMWEQRFAPQIVMR